MTAKKFNNLELKQSIREKLNEHADLINENKEAIENISWWSLDDLSDVIITTPTSWQALTYNGTDWVNLTPASWDMLKSTYDTNDNGIVDDSEALNWQAGSHYLARTNHTWTQLANTISNFQSTVSSNTDVDANTTARHTHANKALLDTYTNTNEDISDAISKEHTHANKAILDATTASYTTAEASKLAGIESGAEVNTLNDVIAWTNITIDKTDPLNPIITSTASGTWDVTWPASSVNNNVVFFDWTTWKLIKDSWLTLSWTNTWDQDLSWKQDVLVSWTNIKTINSTSILWSGNIEVWWDPLSIVSDTTWISWSDRVENIISLTKAEYDAITPDPATIYNITDDNVWGWDMLKSIYDTNDNWIVDNSEALEWQSWSYYLDTDNHTDWTNNKVYTAIEKTKLTWIETWAQVNVWTNLSIWSSTWTVVRVDSSTWNNATIPNASATVAWVITTWTQTVAWIKTFSSSPIVPAPTTDMQAATKKYVDDNAGWGWWWPEKLRITIPWELIADTANYQWLYFKNESWASWTISNVAIAVWINASGTWSACAINLYKSSWSESDWINTSATALFTSAVDLGTTYSSLTNTPNTTTVENGRWLSLRVTSSAWATRRASDMQVIITLT